MADDQNYNEPILGAKGVSFVRPSGKDEGTPLMHCYQPVVQTQSDGTKVLVGKKYLGTEVKLDNDLKVFADKTTFAVV